MREAAKLAQLLESASLKKNYMNKNYEKYVLNSWLSVLHFSMHKDCIRNN